MRKFVAFVCLLASVCLSGCGANGVNPANINGTWNATLTNSNNQTEFNFGTSLIVNGDGTLSISNFSFTTSSPCFVSEETESGSFTLSGNFNGSVTGTFNFDVISGEPVGNTLSLTGTASGNTISGTWKLNGSGCVGSGTFVMTHS